MTNFVSKLIGFNPLQKQKYVPRSTVFIIELCIVAIAFAINYIILSNSKIDYSSVFPFGVRFSLFIMMIAASFLIFGTHRASIRFTSLKDIIRLFIALTVAMVALTLFNFLYFLNVGEYIFVYAGLLYSGIMGLLFLAVFRLSVKYMYIRLKYIKKVGEKRRLLMVGTQHENISVVKAINYTEGGQSRFVGFLSFDKTAKHLRILGLDIWYDQMFYDHFNDEKPVDGVVILGDQKQDEGVVALMDFCIQNRIQIYQSSISRIIENKGNEELQFKKAVLEDLLFREPIVINKNEVDIFLRGKNILVTGAAGSIGSELSRQICQFGPGKLILLDIAETPLFYIENELRDLHPDLEIIAFLGDIGDKEGMEVLFEEDTPDVVLHAAAYKHVPMMEKHPDKAFKVNFFGTKNIIDLCIRYKVPRMVQISTDKAVNPTNIMGLTKRLAELYLQLKIVQMQQDKKTNHQTQIITTRFGNVLGSNGSVIPVFEKKIRNREAITITDPNMTRYFMTIPEASSLVLQAATSGNTGEILVFDMGKPIKILDMAEKLVRLNGLEPYKDIQIVYIGKRPGEKLYEELFYENSVTVPTNHIKILKVLENMPPPETVKAQFLELEASLFSGDIETILLKAKELVPEFDHATDIKDSRYSNIDS